MSQLLTESWGIALSSFRGREEKNMAAITSAIIAIAGVILGWIAIEIACKPCLEKGREAIDRSLNPDFDPDDEIHAPLNPSPNLDLERPEANPKGDVSSSETPSDPVKTV